ncbi:Hypothetical predicted protein [Cloeon dipterum]|uniref:Uncharacterized protein n=1 Tax=Cloeon dipterum TaxID=197152 RepID=A0A8S1CDB8_9INSE|nr:Hypothetical predicted protein [Cloeon dipterum]
MFSLNKQQTTKKGWNNSFPLNDSSIGKSLYPLAYFADCWFRAKGVINNETGEIDAAALATFITTNQTEYWAMVLGEAATACVEVVTAMSPPLFVKDKKSNVSSTAFFVAQCLAFVSIEYCETKLTTTSCNKDYAMFDTCKNYLYQELANNGGSKLKSASSLRGAKKAAKFQVQGNRSAGCCAWSRRNNSHGCTHHSNGSTHHNHGSTHHNHGSTYHNHGSTNHNHGSTNNYNWQNDHVQDD